MRKLWTHIHRWIGLGMAGFLFLTGLTGAIISWDHELDDLLNGHLMEARLDAAPIPSLELARRVEAADPRVRVTFVPLAPEKGESVGLGVEPRVDTANRTLYDIGYNQLFLEPSTGDELGRREWGAISLSRENLVSFLYKLHYSLHIPEMWGIDRWGIWLLGVIAVFWTVDCFIGFYLTLPVRRAARQPAGAERAALAVARGSVSDGPGRAGNGADAGSARGTSGSAGAGGETARSWARRWQPAWRVRWRSGSYKLNFDLHRALGLWTWVLLFVLAFTAFSLNLYREVFHPAMSLVSDVTPTPFDKLPPVDKLNPIEAKLSFGHALALARSEANRRGWEAPAGSIFYSPDYGIYGISFFHAGDDHGAAGVGPAALYLDGADGRIVGEKLPWTGTAADIFLQMQFPVHSGRILGLPGRILISAMGVVVAALSVTGVVIWLRKRRSRTVAVRNSAVRAEGLRTQ